MGLGLVAHSVRAVSQSSIAALHSEARRLGLPFHMHLEEQPRELQDATAHFGSPPLKVPSVCPPPCSASSLNPILQTVMGAVETGAEFTAVHLTHTSREDFSSLLARGGNVCVCPLTEGRLGDGIPSLPESFAPSQLSLGSDCNARICFAEELRWLLYCHQMKSGSRGFPGRSPAESGPILLQMASQGGARSLGLAGQTGSLEPGCWADFFLLDLAHPLLAVTGLELAFLAHTYKVDTGLEGRLAPGRLYLRRCQRGSHRGNFCRRSASQLPPRGAVFSLALFPVRFPRQSVGGGVKESDCRAMKQLSEVAETEVVALTTALMLVNSTSGDEGRLGTELGDWLEARGWSVLLQPLPEQPKRRNLLATRSPFELGKEGGPAVLLCSHLDTVPPFIPPSFSEDGTILHGRWGTCHWWLGSSLERPVSGAPMTPKDRSPP